MITVQVGIHGARRATGSCTAAIAQTSPVTLCPEPAQWNLPSVPVGDFCTAHASHVIARHAERGCGGAR